MDRTKIFVIIFCTIFVFKNTFSKKTLLESLDEISRMLNTSTPYSETEDENFIHQIAKYAHLDIKLKKIMDKHKIFLMGGIEN